MTQVQQPKLLKDRLLAMMFLRVVLALTFLGVTTWIQITQFSFSHINFYPLYTVVIVVCLLTIFYAVALARVKNLRLFAYTQVTIDIALVTAIVYITGGMASYLQILYFLSITGSAIILRRRGGMYAAVISSVSYGLLVDLDFYGILPLQFKLFLPAIQPAWDDVLTTALTNILAFFIVAYLTGYLAEKMASVERELEEKGIDYERLEELNRLIVENITSGILTVDELARVTYFNKAAEDITGYTLQEVYYRPVEKIFPEIFAETAGIGVRLERTVKRKDGAEIFLGFAVSDGHGGDASKIVIFQDLTQLKGMEARLARVEKLRALGELSVGIAHEVRNPLASISGSIQVLKQDLDLKGDDQRLMDIVVRETDRLNALISDFLLFAKPAEKRRERINLSEVIAEKMELFSHSPQATGLKIESDVKEQLYIHGDLRQMGQLFWNLFLNSAQSMHEGGRLSVSSVLINGADSAGRTGTGLPSGGLSVEIDVADTGCGIKPEELQRIFDPFFSTKDLGTGLGLAIAHRIVESHNGVVKVKSEVDKGTVFKILLPLIGAGTLH